MIARTIHLLLIPSLLFCPLFCSGSVGGPTADCCAAGPQPTQGCAACHVDDHGDLSRSTPAGTHENSPPRDNPPIGHSCQCICGGAVLVDGVQIDHSPWNLPVWTADFDDASTLFSATPAGPPSGDFYLQQRDVAATPGRLLRCRYASLLL